MLNLLIFLKCLGPFGLISVIPVSLRNSISGLFVSLVIEILGLLSSILFTGDIEGEGATYFSSPDEDLALCPVGEYEGDVKVLAGGLPSISSRDSSEDGILPSVLQPVS